MNVLHRTTAELRLSANTPDFPVETWIHDPRDPHLLAAVPQKYRVIEGDDWREMDAGEKATVDAAELAAATAAATAVADAAIDGLDGYSLRAIVKLLIDEINALRTRDRDRSTDVAAATSLNDLKTRWAARSSMNDRTLSQAKTAYKNLLAGNDLDE